jgi:hypothetical protein
VRMNVLLSNQRVSGPVASPAHASTKGRIRSWEDRNPDET